MIQLLRMPGGLVHQIVLWLVLSLMGEHRVIWVSLCLVSQGGLGGKEQRRVFRPQTTCLTQKMWDVHTIHSEESLRMVFTFWGHRTHIIVKNHLYRGGIPKRLGSNKRS